MVGPLFKRHRWIVCLVAGLTLASLAACASMPSARQATTPFGAVADVDAARLVALGGQATQLARQTVGAEVILRQVDTDLTQTTFRFTDGGATKEIDILIPASAAPTEQWKIETESVTPLVGFVGPSLDLSTLRAGPGRVAQAIANHWPGCTLRFMTLYLNDSRRLVWTAFCNTSQGLAAGDMDNATGVFQPSPFPPAQMPVTATPLP